MADKVEAPSVRNALRDPRRNMTYHVLAYRRLTREELLLAVRQYHALPAVRRRKTPLRDRTITILGIPGAMEGL